MRATMTVTQAVRRTTRKRPKADPPFVAEPWRPCQLPEYLFRRRAFEFFTATKPDQIRAALGVGRGELLNAERFSIPGLVILPAMTGEGLFTGVFCASDPAKVEQVAEQCDDIARQFILRAARLRKLAAALRADRLANIAEQAARMAADAPDSWQAMQDAAVREEREVNADENEKPARPANRPDVLRRRSVNCAPAASSRGSKMHRVRSG